MATEMATEAASMQQNGYDNWLRKMTTTNGYGLIRNGHDKMATKMTGLRVEFLLCGSPHAGLRVEFFL